MSILKPINCKKCGNKMQWQITELEKLVHCHDCRRVVIVVEDDLQQRLKED